jgi:hypothetical protein
VPYKAGNRLGFESANKIGHLELIKSELINKIVAILEAPISENEFKKIEWMELNTNVETLQTIFCVDGSLQAISSNTTPKRELSFIKTALLTLDQKALSKIDPDYPHPFRLKKIMEESSLYHSTVLPLRNIKLPDLSIYNTVRKIIYDSFKDEALESEVMETLKWLIYKKWTKNTVSSMSFQCPHCEKEIDGMDFDKEIDNCKYCKNEIYITDILGFHLDMQEDSIPVTVATSYMLVHETMLLFSAIRFFWDTEKYNTLKNTLFLKDGPLALYGQYSKLVPRIRDFIEYARDNGISLYIAGQEKSGKFVEYLDMLSINSPDKLSYFIPNNEFIDKEIRERPNRNDPYGIRVNYGNKIFVCNDKYHHIVLSIPTGEYKDTDKLEDLIGVEKIIKTVNSLKSYKYENALLPIQLANGIASLSTYPSAKVLKLFSSKIIDN